MARNEDDSIGPPNLAISCTLTNRLHPPSALASLLVAVSMPLPARPRCFRRCPSRQSPGYCWLRFQSNHCPARRALGRASSQLGVWQAEQGASAWHGAPRWLRGVLEVPVELEEERAYSPPLPGRRMVSTRMQTCPIYSQATTLKVLLVLALHDIDARIYEPLPSFCVTNTTSFFLMLSSPSDCPAKSYRARYVGS